MLFNSFVIIDDRINIKRQGWKYILEIIADNYFYKAIILESNRLHLKIYLRTNTKINNIFLLLILNKTDYIYKY